MADVRVFQFCPFTYCVTKCMCILQSAKRTLCQRTQARPHKTRLLDTSCSVTHISCRGLSSRQIQAFCKPMSIFRWQRTDLVPGIADVKKKSNIKCFKLRNVNPMFIGPCIIAIVDEWKTNLMSLAILFHLLCAQHVSDINISIIRSSRLCWWKNSNNLTVGLTSRSNGISMTNLTNLSANRRVQWSNELQQRQVPTDILFQKFWCGCFLVVFVLQAGACKTTKNQPHPKLQHTTNWEQDDRCGNPSTQSRAPEDGYINVRNMLST